MSSRNELGWLFGDLFDRRIEFEASHRESAPSHMISTIKNNEATSAKWAASIRDYRNALVNPEVAPQKVADELRVNVRDFDACLFDCFAEIAAVFRLQTLGFRSFEVVMREPNESTPDLKALRNEDRAVIDVKNLRPHETVETLLPKLFYDRKLKGEDMGSIRLEVRRSFRGTLNASEKVGLNRILCQIKAYPRNEYISESLSERAAANFIIVDGMGDAICSDAVVLSELISDMEAFDGLFSKIVSNLSDAVRQLYSPAASTAGIRVAAMRWDVPSFRITIPGQLREVAAQRLREAMTAAGKPIDLLVFTDYEFDLFSSLNLQMRST